MNEDYIKFWLETKKKGKKRYIILYALNIFILLSIFLFILIHNSFTVKYDMRHIGYVLFCIIFFSIIGFIGGNILWNVNEKIYKNIVTKD